MFSTADTVEIDILPVSYKTLVCLPSLISFEKLFMCCGCEYNIMCLFLSDESISGSEREAKLLWLSDC